MKKQSQANEKAQAEGSLVFHLVELRNRLLRIAAVVLVIFLCLAPFADALFALVAQPLMAKLPEGTSMIATQVASPFLTPFKTAMVAALFISMPWLLYQLWAFIAPGLYQHEKRLALPLVITSALLFYGGVAFAYFVVFPLMFAFFTTVAPQGVSVMTDINAYLDFVLTLFFAFGLAFEVPIATVLSVWAGFTTPARLGSHRPYVLLGAFVVGMLLTPPDVISQTLLAVPVYVLYEAGIIMARIMVPGHKEVESQQNG
jgi:sec-independent protein translocase protein TatC